MLQGVKPSALIMPNLSHHHSLTCGSKMEHHYNNIDPWAAWQQQQQLPPPPQQQHTTPTASHGYHSVFGDSSLYSPFGDRSELTTPHNSAPPVSVADQNPSPPPAQRQQNNVSGALVKPQPAFKPTWHGYLDTTKDAMTIVEAALQGRLSHISRRPHDKERAEMLVSGTVLVYEENASGIKRWTDAVHWSPSRVMNNCLIYRQLVRALKPEEKKTGLNASGASKRKRKEDEFGNNSMFDDGIPGDMTPTTDPGSAGKQYANFAQSLHPDQQRRYCGSLVDSYEFKEGGLMKKTISVKFKGTHHHVISYYSLEDVVSGKLMRPFQDPKLAGIVPRPELLSGWKVSLEDEESKDLPMMEGYPQTTSPQQHVPTEVVPRGIPQSMTPQGMPHPVAAHPHPPLPVNISATATTGEYWQPTDQAPPQFQQHPQQPPPTQPYQQPPPPPQNTYYAPQHANQTYSPQYPHHPQAPPQFPAYSPQDQSISPVDQYPPQHPHLPTPQQQQYPVPQQQQYYSLPMHNLSATVTQHDHRRGSSGPIKVETAPQQEQQAPQPGQQHFGAGSPTYYRAEQGAPQPFNPSGNQYGF